MFNRAFRLAASNMGILKRIQFPQYRPEIIPMGKTKRIWLKKYNWQNSPINLAVVRNSFENLTEVDSLFEKDGHIFNSQNFEQDFRRLGDSESFSMNALIRNSQGKMPKIANKGSISPYLFECFHAKSLRRQRQPANYWQR